MYNGYWTLNKYYDYYYEYIHANGYYSVFIEYMKAFDLIERSSPWHKILSHKVMVNYLMLYTLSATQPKQAYN